MGIAVLGLAVIGAGAYAGWRYYDELPANALADMPKKMAALKSAAYQLQLRLRVNPASEKTASLGSFRTLKLSCG
ncbi:hypothetical protein HYW68_00475 [Candidatus Parcubacteria bacterium]|nr:hypothetical protein [Candidatus Parcubacteria bacterium]